MLDWLLDWVSSLTLWFKLTDCLIDWFVKRGMKGWSLWIEFSIFSFSQWNQSINRPLTYEVLTVQLHLEMPRIFVLLFNFRMVLKRNILPFKHDYACSVTLSSWVFHKPMPRYTNQGPVPQTNASFHKPMPRSTNQDLFPQTNAPFHKPMPLSTNQGPVTQTNASLHKPRPPSITNASFHTCGGEWTISHAWFPLMDGIWPNTTTVWSQGWLTRSVAAELVFEGAVTVDGIIREDGHHLETKIFFVPKKKTSH